MVISHGTAHQSAIPHTFPGCTALGGTSGLPCIPLETPAGTGRAASENPGAGSSHPAAHLGGFVVGGDKTATNHKSQLSGVQVAFQESRCFFDRVWFM